MHHLNHIENVCKYKAFCRPEKGVHLQKRIVFEKKKMKFKKNSIWKKKKWHKCNKDY